MGVEIVVGGARATERTAVERLFLEWERVFSRFRPESELNAVNAVALLERGFVSAGGDLASTAPVETELPDGSAVRRRELHGRGCRGEGGVPSLRRRTGLARRTGFGSGLLEFGVLPERRPG